MVKESKSKWWQGTGGIEVRKYESCDCKALRLYLVLSTIANLFLLMVLLASKAHASEIAIETIAREASNQPFEAQVAVASVIKTRMEERHQTAEEVCKAKWQFSCWNPGVVQKPRTSQEIETAKKAWDLSKANGMNLYHDTSVSPKWAKSKKVTFLCQVGKMKFYREARNG